MKIIPEYPLSWSTLSPVASLVAAGGHGKMAEPCHGSGKVATSNANGKRMGEGACSRHICICAGNNAAGLEKQWKWERAQWRAGGTEGEGEKRNKKKVMCMCLNATSLLNPRWTTYQQTKSRKSLLDLLCMVSQDFWTWISGFLVYGLVPVVQFTQKEINLA